MKEMGRGIERDGEREGKRWRDERKRWLEGGRDGSA